jgi:hypothetical protein
MEAAPVNNIWKLIMETENSLKLLDENQQEAIKFLGGPQSRYGRYGEENILPLPGIEARPSRP